MIVLIVDPDKLELISGTYTNNSQLAPVKDADGNLVLGVQVLEDDNFLEIRDILLSFKQIDFNPAIEE